MKNSEKFIIKSNNKHSFKYDYTLVKYINSTSKVVIKCLIHGVFTQQPAAHVRGDGCPNCVKNKKMNKIDFINKAKVIHGNKYNYSNVEYINSNTKINIVCPEHGVFEQLPSIHIIGHGCSHCGKTGKLNNYLFINKAKLVHGDKFDYSLVDYESNKTKIQIICSKHGIFEQTPNSHLSGNGCLICKESKGEIIVRKILENNKINFIYQYKFNDCRNILPLPFDFYLPDYNTCIEFDGIQHFKSIDGFGGVNSFVKTQKK